jgi:hypothetical protein
MLAAVDGILLDKEASARAYRAGREEFDLVDNRLGQALANLGDWPSSRTGTLAPAGPPECDRHWQENAPRNH